MYLSFNSTCNTDDDSSDASILFFDKIKSIFIGSSGKIVISFLTISFNHSTWNSTDIFSHATVFVLNSNSATQFTNST